MIAATLSVFTTPWNLFSNPEVIHYTIDILACAIGPLYGILLVDYYVIKKEQIVVEDLYSMSPNGRYWYQGGVNLKAVYGADSGVSDRVYFYHGASLQRRPRFLAFYWRRPCRFFLFLACQKHRFGGCSRTNDLSQCTKSVTWCTNASSRL